MAREKSCNWGMVFHRGWSWRDGRWDLFVYERSLCTSFSNLLLSVILGECKMQSRSLIFFSLSILIYMDGTITVHIKNKPLFSTHAHTHISCFLLTSFTHQSLFSLILCRRASISAIDWGNQIQKKGVFSFLFFSHLLNLVVTFVMYIVNNYRYIHRLTLTNNSY